MTHIALVLLLATAAVAQDTTQNPAGNVGVQDRRYPPGYDPNYGSFVVYPDSAITVTVTAGFGKTYRVDDSPWKFISGDSATVIASGDTVHTTKGVYQTMVLMTLVHEWRAYQQACYDDSMLTPGYISQQAWMPDEYRWVPGAARGGDWIDPTWVRNESCWTHREPSFKGFMSWIEKGINK